MIAPFAPFIILLATLAIASQPSAPPPVAQPIRPLPWGQLNFLHTTDTHGWHAGHLQESQYSADWGDYISFAQRMRDKADTMKVDMLLIDTGDRIEGNGLYDASKPKGAYTYDIVKEQDIDVICIGNHELYVAASVEREYARTVPNFKGKYLASNLDVLDPKTGDRVPLAQRSRKFTTKNQGIRILAMGFLYNFAGNANNSFVQPVEKTVEEKWFQDAIRDKEVDLFCIIGHVDIRDPEFQVIFKAIRKANWDTPIQFFGGHRHVRDFRTFDSTAHAIASGRYMETIGFLSIDGLDGKSKETQQEPDVARGLKVERRYIDNNLFGLYYHAGLNQTTFPTEHGKNVSKFINEAREELNLDHNFGCAPQDLWLNRAKYPSGNSILTWLEKQVLPDVVVGEDRADSPRLAIINSGAMRFDIFKGPFTRDTTFIVSPFISGFKYIQDVPYSAAKGVLDLLNSGGPVFSGMSLENQHLSAPIPATFESQAAAESSRLWHHQSHESVQRPLANSKPEILPGYTTSDDAGDDGDDTLHSPIKNFNTPNCVQAQIAFPQDAEPEMVDLVFLEFITPWMLLALRFRGLDVSEKDIMPYMADKSFTELIAGWVQDNWSKDC